jgi:hypothetical protein
MDCPFYGSSILMSDLERLFFVDKERVHSLVHHLGWTRLLSPDDLARVHSLVHQLEWTRLLSPDDLARVHSLVHHLGWMRI